MNKEIVSDKQGVALIILFIIGTSIIYASGIKAKKDIWMAILLSFLIALPLAFVFARLHYIFPSKNFFDICEICFGRFIGKGIILFYIWFNFHTGVLVLMNLNLFIHTVSLVETPQVIIMINIVSLCAWAVKAGIEAMGRWARFFQPILIALIAGTILLLIPKMDVNNLRPILFEGMNPVIRGAFGILAFPFTQIAIFTIVFTHFETKKSPFRIYILGLCIGGIVLLFISTMNILVLGVDLASNTYYPSHASATAIDVGMIIQRVEIIISIGFVVGAFIKSSIYLIATCQGIAKICRTSDYRFTVIPVALLMINLSYFLHDSLMDYFYWILEIWTYYAMPFQVVFPIIVWSFAEIKKKTLGNPSN